MLYVPEHTTAMDQDKDEFPTTLGSVLNQNRSGNRMRRGKGKGGTSGQVDKGEQMDKWTRGNKWTSEKEGQPLYAFEQATAAKPHTYTHTHIKRLYLRMKTTNKNP